MLTLSALPLTTGLMVLGLAPSFWVYLAGWLLMGLGIGCGLYDPAFAALGRLYGAWARPAITTLTLWGGLASTVRWPLSAFLLGHGGWRWACFVYTGPQLAVSLPLILGLIPPKPARPAGAKVSPAPMIALAPAKRSLDCFATWTPAQVEKR
jgi:predicted MFS family arabinose efflux permease